MPYRQHLIKRADDEIKYFRGSYSFLNFTFNLVGQFLWKSLLSAGQMSPALPKTSPPRVSSQDHVVVEHPKY